MQEKLSNKNVILPYIPIYLSFGESKKRDLENGR
jgi:hypothetical protein